jgi:hypothetical protein
LAEDPITFLQDFERELGLRSDLGQIDVRPVNEGLSTRVLPAVRFANLFFAGDVGYKNRLVHLPARWDDRMARTRLFQSVSKLPVLRRGKSGRAMLGASMAEMLDQYYAEFDLARYAYPGTAGA